MQGAKLLYHWLLYHTKGNTDILEKYEKEMKEWHCKWLELEHFDFMCCLNDLSKYYPAIYDVALSHHMTSSNSFVQQWLTYANLKDVNFYEQNILDFIKRREIDKKGVRARLGKNGAQRLKHLQEIDPKRIRRIDYRWKEAVHGILLDYHKAKKIYSKTEYSIETASSKDEYAFNQR